MAAIEAAIYSHLTAQAGLTALIGTRLYPLKAPDSATDPYVVYTKVSAVREVSHSGTSNLTQARIRFGCWSADYLTAKNVSLQIVKALNGIRFTAGGGESYGGNMDQERDLFDEDAKMHQVSVDYLFWHKEEIT